MSAPATNAEIEVLYQQYGAHVRHICTSMLGGTICRDQVDDAIQNTWISIWRTTHRPESMNECWVGRVAANACRDLFKKASRHPMLSLENEVSRHPALHPHIEDESEHIVTKDMLARIRAICSPTECTVLSLLQAGYGLLEVGHLMHKNCSYCTQNLTRIGKRARKELTNV